MSKAEDRRPAEKTATAEAAGDENLSDRYQFKLTVHGPRRFRVLYDGVLTAETEAEATDFLAAFRRLLMNGGAIPNPEPGPGEVSIRKDGPTSRG